MKEDKKTNEPFPPDYTPTPPDHAPEAKNNDTNPQGDTIPADFPKDGRNPGNQQEEKERKQKTGSSKRLGESPLEIDDETTI